MGLKGIRPIVVSGPSGSGKSTLLNKLFSKHSGIFGFSVSHTTRKPRAGEVDGREYHFVSEDMFKKMIENNEFLEWARYSSFYYGTSFRAITELQNQGKIPVLDIDLTGVLSIKQLNNPINACFVFIQAKDLDTLKTRLLSRGSESLESISKRLEISKKEIDYAYSTPGIHDLIIVNDVIEASFSSLESFIFGHSVKE